MENNNNSYDIKSFNLNVLIPFFTWKWYNISTNFENMLVISFAKINWNYDILFSFFIIIKLNTQIFYNNKWIKTNLSN